MKVGRVWQAMLALIVILSFLCVHPTAQAGIVGAWLFDEGSGTVVNDASGNGLTGTIGGSPQWLAEGESVFGSALRFEDGDYVDFGPPTPAALLVEEDISFMVWCKPHEIVSHWQVVFSMQRGSSGGEAYAMTYGSNDDQLRIILNTASEGDIQIIDPDPFTLDEWIHAAATYDGRTAILYRNGEPVAQDSTSTSGPFDHGDGNGRFAINGNYNSLNGGLGEYTISTLDEVLIFDEVLSQEQIQGVMELGYLNWRLGPGVATDPEPENEATDVPCDVVLGWAPGDYVATHDVYLRTSFDDVNAADRTNLMDTLLSQDQTATTCEPEALLEYEQTYYWRIDEVNGAPDYAIHRGKVWSFTTEPLAYPITDVTASSNVDSPANSGPENTVNASGLDSNNLHSIEAGDMWLSTSAVGESVWIQYEFDRVYKLHELWVWNYNVQFELALGFGVKEATIQYSEDGENWTTWGDVEFAQGTALADYAHNTTVDMGGVAAQYVRLNINAGWGIMGQYGLSEVRFLYIPTHARKPEPADGATDVSPGTSITWRAGRDAVAHDVYLGTDPDALELVASTDALTYTPDNMAFGCTYYWRVDEVSETETTPVWQGNLWSFSTPEFLVVDDFESYDNNDNVIYETWIDGWTNENGSTVGYLSDPFAETTIVHSGAQSMPLFYDNSDFSTAEAELSLAQDWTVNDIKSLSLHFYGDPDNTGQLYLKINDATVSYDGDITTAAWRPWNIDLSTVGGNLSNVSTLTIGVEGAGATGVVYIDDVRLYPRTPEFTTPTDPGNEGLLLEYTFDNGASDSSGNGYDGTLLGDAHSADGVLVLDGDDDAVSVPRIGGDDTVFSQCSYSMWLYSTAEPASLSHTGGINSNGWTTGGIHCKISSGVANTGIYTLSGGDMTGTTVVDADVWVHLALTVSDNQAAIYLNGQLEDSRSFDTPMTIILGEASVGAWYNASGEIVRELTGQMDNVRIYDRALAEAEILWLAGKRNTIHTPF